MLHFITTMLSAMAMASIWLRVRWIIVVLSYWCSSEIVRIVHGRFGPIADLHTDVSDVGLSQ